MERLRALAASAARWWRARSASHRVGKLHIKMDQLTRRLAQDADALEQRFARGLEVDKGTQILLGLKYRELAAQQIVLPLREVEFRNFSQSGEDGILHYIFTLIGTTDRRAVEICAGAGSECNSANLVIHHGWQGLLVDGSESNVLQGRAFFAARPETRINGPVFAHAWVDRKSVNGLLQAHDVTGEVDLLSVDIDGVDYWIWDAITVISPRVVVVEVNLTMSESSVTVPYKPGFRAQWIALAEQPGGQRPEGLHEREDFYSRFAVYAGASLPAFVKLARRKGYRLVGTNTIGFNAFFMRDDVGLDHFPEVSAESCVNPGVAAHSDVAVQKLKDYAWQEV